MSTRTISTALAAVASDYTEADETCHGDPLVALANHRYQLYSGETAGVIGLYEDAAVRCGIPRQQLHADEVRLRNRLAGIDDRTASRLTQSLCDDVQAYRARQITADTLQRRQALWY